MKNSSFAIISILAVMLSGCSNISAPKIDNPNVSPTPQTVEKISTSFAELKNQSNTQCTYSYSDQEVTSTGTVYIGQGNLRSDIQTVINDEAMMSHLIIDGNTMSVWQEGESSGVQFDYLKAQQMASQYIQQYKDSTTAPTIPDLNQKYDYQCKPWQVDASQFALPTNVTFTDMTKQMEKLQSFQPTQQKLPVGAPADACGACEQLNGEQKNQCLQILKC